MRHVARFIDTMAHEVDVEMQRLAMPLDLQQLTCAWRKTKIADAKDFLLARDREDDDEFDGQLPPPARIPSI
jgi:hypothetical protein